MLHKVKTHVVALAKHPHAEVYFFLFCFIEAFMLPIPTTLMQAPMAISQPSRGARYVWIASIASTLGGVVGYCVGMFFFSLIEPHVLASSYAKEFLEVQGWFLRWGFLVLFPIALCPIPFKLTTWSAGLLGMPFLPFFGIIAVARYIHFYIIGAIIDHGQKKFRRWMLRRYTPAEPDAEEA